MSVRKNEKLIIEITGMTADGNGVGKTENGFAVFVSGSAVGDVLNVLVVKVLKNYAFGKILEVITASKDRISADCTAFMKCGGCTFRHITYESELKIKQQRVKDAIMRIGGLENVKINPISDAASQNFYRNKAQLPIGVLPNGDAVCGFYALHSHRIIQCTSCKLQPEFFSKITSALLDYIKSAKEAVYDEHK